MWELLRSPFLRTGLGGTFDSSLYLIVLLGEGFCLFILTT